MNRFSSRLSRPGPLIFTDAAYRRRAALFTNDGLHFQHDGHRGTELPFELPDFVAQPPGFDLFVSELRFDPVELLASGSPGGHEFIPPGQEGVRAVHGCAGHPSLFGEARFRQPPVGIDRGAGE